MFNIPKLARGGLLTPPEYCFIRDNCEDKDIVPCNLIDKYHVIYKRTKKARIRKKAAKKSWLLTLKRECEKPIIIKIRGEGK